VRRLLRVMGPAAAVAVLIVVGPAVPAYAATKTISASGTPGCPAGQAATSVTITLDRISAGQQITVQTAVSAVTRSPDSIKNGVATYNVALDGKYQGATATVDTWWNGTFTVAGATCQSAQAPTVAVGSSGPGVSPVTLIVQITNNTDAMATYQVSTPGHTVQTASVLGHRTQEVDFYPVNCGTTYRVSVSGDDGSSASGSGTTVACRDSTPTPPVSVVPTTTPGTVGITPLPSGSLPVSGSLSASASVSGSVSASPSVSASLDSLGAPLLWETDGPSATTNVAAGGSKPKQGSPLFTLVNILLCVGLIAMVLGFMTLWRLFRRGRAGSSPS